MHEGPAEQVASDEHALVAEPRLREERIGSAQVSGGQLVGGDAGARTRDQHRHRLGVAGRR
ncbi:MAG: hypothetical protein M0Z42_21170 [Actinomycetota bacterium]|nr:hypothetical protein [Actinomycetota bacterium]